ncbi:MAG: FlgO family outer membrane protein [Desulfurivibrio sp.]|nr:FlgO family outer membrane protein [Desulfurivibrio sp.]
MLFARKNRSVVFMGWLAVLVAVTPLPWWPVPGALADRGEGRDEDGRVAPPRDLIYNQYQYNYPHQLPADYVFRTGRVFSPWELERAPGETPEEAARTAPQATPPALADREIADLVRELLRGGGYNIRDGYTLAVSPPVNLNDLYATSSFGRLLGERLLGELQRAGVEVIDVRRTPALLIHERQGEYGLSRDMDELSYVQNAQAVLVGTYTVGVDRVLVELRVVDNQDGRILTSAGHDFDLDREIAALLADESRPPRPATPVEVR